MRTNFFAFIFLILGIAAIGGCLYFALLPSSYWNGRSNVPTNENAGMASIAMAIISFGCFIACTFIIKKK